MSETCEVGHRRVADGMCPSCDRDRLTAELAKVKGELKELETEYSDREMVSDGEICCLGIDRDHWRGIAEKVKGELEKVSKFGADEMLRRGDAMAKQLFLIQDRDRWRGIAEGAREVAEKALDHVQENVNGCLYCGDEEDSLGNEVLVDGDITDFHRKECWYYKAKEALAAFPPPGPKEPS